MAQNNKTKRFFGELKQLPDGSFKVAFMRRLVGVNQHKHRWETVPSREFARELNKSQLVTR